MTFNNSLRPSDAYMCKLPPLAHIMACRLVGAKPLSDKVYIVNWSPSNNLQWNINRNSYISIKENEFQNVWKMAAILSQPQCVNGIRSLSSIGLGNVLVTKTWENILLYQHIPLANQRYTIFEFCVAYFLTRKIYFVLQLSYVRTPNLVLISLSYALSWPFCSTINVCDNHISSWVP